MNFAQYPSTTFWICTTLLFGTETLGPRCQKEGSSKAIWETPKPIGEVVQEMALWRMQKSLSHRKCGHWRWRIEAKIWARWVNWAERRNSSKPRFSRLNLLLFKVTQRVPSFPSISIFEFNEMKSVPLFSDWFYDFVYKVISPTFMGVFGTILNVWTAKESDAFLSEHQLPCEFYTSTL